MKAETNLLCLECQNHVYIVALVDSDTETKAMLNNTQRAEPQELALCEGTVHAAVI